MLPLQHRHPLLASALLKQFANRRIEPDDNLEAAPVFDEYSVTTAGICNPVARRHMAESAEKIGQLQRYVGDASMREGRTQLHNPSDSKAAAHSPQHLEVLDCALAICCAYRGRILARMFLTSRRGRARDEETLHGVQSSHDDRDLHFHDLRGTAAKQFYVAGPSIRLIAEILAWSEEQVERIIRRYVARGAATKAAVHQLNEAQKGTLPANLAAKPTP